MNAPKTKRKLVGYEDCRCILTQYCDGKCRPIFADVPLPDAPSRRSADTEGTGQMPPNGSSPAASPILAAPASEQSLPDVYISGPYTVGKNAGRRSVCDFATGRVLGYLVDGASEQGEPREALMDACSRVLSLFPAYQAATQSERVDLYGDGATLTVAASLRASPAVPVAQDERALTDDDIRHLVHEHGEGVTRYANHSTVEFTFDGFRAALSAATPPAAPICWAMACSNRLEQPPEWLDLAQPAVSAEALAPVEGDELPAIGSKVLIHLASLDKWVEHTVVGYYVWGDLGGSPSLHRVFVRVRAPEGHLNARLLKDVRAAMAPPADNKENGNG